MSKVYETKPLTSFVYKPFYLYQFHSVWTYIVKGVNFSDLKIELNLSFILEKTYLSHGMSKRHETKPLTS